MAVTPADSPAKKEAREALFTEIARQAKEVTELRIDTQAAALKHLAEAYASVAGAPAQGSASSMY